MVKGTTHKGLAPSRLIPYLRYDKDAGHTAFKLGRTGRNHTFWFSFHCLSFGEKHPNKTKIGLPPLQRLNTTSWLYFTNKNSIRNGYNRDCYSKLIAAVTTTNLGR